MRLHTLEITAFGPFAGTERVCFDPLADAGLFLLHGRTGAGKTSILDAVGYALYGVVPGARQRGARLRSDHADVTDRTSVTLELTVHGRRLRVRRQPAWERAKRRGAGTTTSPATCLVDELGCDGWTTLTTRNDEAGHLLRGLLGMSADQFFQVVLLPQGQFAEFLRADAESRRALLEQLFDTRRFSSVESWLGEQRRQTSRAVEEATVEVNNLLARTAQAAAPLLDGGTDDRADSTVAGDPSRTSDHSTAVFHISPEAAPAWVGLLVERALGLADAATAAHRDAEVDHHRLSVERDAARETARRRQRRAEVRARVAAVQAARPRAAALAATIDEARRAATVVPLLSVLSTRERQRVSAAKARSAAFAALERHEVATELANASDPVARIREVLPELRTELAHLRSLGAQEKTAAQARRQRVAAAEEYERVREELDGAQSLVAAGVGTEETLRAQCRTAVEHAAGAPALRAQVDQLTDRRAGAIERDARCRELAGAEETLRSAVDAAQQARDDWLDLREARILGISAELAAGLVVGCRCPVCGSPDHPHPAAASVAAVTEAHESAAQRFHQETETIREVAELQVASLRAALAAATAKAGGATSLPELDRLLAERRTALVCAAQAADRVPRLEAELRQLLERISNARNRVSALAVHATELGTRQSELDETLRRWAATCDAARGDDASLDARRTRIAAVVELGERALGCAADLENAERALAEARICAHDASVAAGFVDLDAVAGAAATEADIEGWVTELEELQAERAAVAALSADPEIAVAESLPVVDVGAAEAALAAAQKRLQHASSSLSAADGVHKALLRLRGALGQQLAVLRPAQQRHEVVDGLSRLVEGTGSDNAKRMRLSSYVLAARLEQVAVAASERLLRMSAGRYTLVHTDEGSGRGRAGLGLRVVDAWTGVERETTSLSGGESFFASLALALGLADVVAGEAGGPAIETLFVDEGFGSLDDDTLDEVMDVLDGLRSGGRVVGIVSHVADLRQRIPAQLHVVKERNGSHIRPTLEAVAT